MHFTVTIIFSSFLLFVSAQNITGKVIDKNQKKLVEALVFVENNGSSFYTDSKGKFTIPTAGFENISLVIFKEGYKDYHLKISKENFGGSYNEILNLYQMVKLYQSLLVQYLHLHP